MLNIKIGQKVSILNAGDLVPSLYKGVIKGFYYSDYAQYKNALYIYIQRPRAKRIDRLVFLPSDTVFIFNGYTWKDVHRKEVIKETEEVTHTLLHKWTYKDVKNNKDLIYHHEYGEEFTGVNDSIERFIDLTGDYICNNDIKAREADKNDNYINYIKELIQNYNVNSLMKYIKSQNYIILEKCLKLATEYNW